MKSLDTSAERKSNGADWTAVVGTAGVRGQGSGVRNWRPQWFGRLFW